MILTNYTLIVSLTSLKSYNGSLYARIESLAVISTVNKGGSSPPLRKEAKAKDQRSLNRAQIKRACMLKKIFLM